MSELFQWSKDPLAAYIVMPDFKAEDLKHTLFPDYPNYRMLDKHLESLFMSIIPEAFVCIKTHIDGLYIPTDKENYFNDIIPKEFPQLLAALIDRAAPDFNLVQKTFLYWIYLVECGKAAQTDYSYRIRDKTTKMAREREQQLPLAKGVPGSEDKGEVDIKNPGADPFDIKKPGQQQMN